MRMLQTHAPAIFLVIVFTLMRFRPFSTIHTNTICMRLNFDPRFQIAALTEGLNASKCMRHSNENALSVDEA